MCRPLLFAAPLFVASLVVIGCGRTSVAPNSTGSGGQSVANQATTGDFLVAEGITHGNLTIFPVLSRMPRTTDRFITLEEGLKAGTVEIFEMGAHAVAQAADQQPGNAAQQRFAQAVVAQRAAPVAANAADAPDDDVQQGEAANEVNRLMIANRSDKPLYLMPGEVIVGGSQDRTIAEETVIAATGEPVPIDVYCVEHGRWGARDSVTAAAIFDVVGGANANPNELTAQANAGRFVATAGALSKPSRLAAQSGEGQGKVWEAVASTVAKTGAESDSGAFTANFVDKDVVDQLQPYLTALADRVAQADRVVGVVVAINGKAESVDVFESTPLFLKLWPRLLKSYALDALNTADAEAAAKTCSVADARSFLETVLEGQVEETKQTDGGLVVTRRNTDSAVSFSAGAANAAGGAGFGGAMGMGGGFGGGGFAPVHAAGYAK